MANTTSYAEDLTAQVDSWFYSTPRFEPGKGGRNYLNTPEDERVEFQSTKFGVWQKMPFGLNKPFGSDKKMTDDALQDLFEDKIQAEEIKAATATAKKLKRNGLAVQQQIAQIKEQLAQLVESKGCDTEEAATYLPPDEQTVWAEFSKTIRGVRADVNIAVTNDGLAEFLTALDNKALATIENHVSPADEHGVTMTQINPETKQEEPVPPTGRNWFKHTSTPPNSQQMHTIYRRLLVPDSKGNNSPLMKVKVDLTGDRKTEIVLLHTEVDKRTKKKTLRQEEGNWTDLIKYKGGKVLLICQISGMWFTSNYWGHSVKATSIMIRVPPPKVKKGFVVPKTLAMDEDEDEDVNPAEEEAAAVDPAEAAQPARFVVPSGGETLADAIQADEQAESTLPAMDVDPADDDVVPL